MFGKLSTRKKAVISSILSGLFLLFLTSPVTDNIVDIATPPHEIRNIQVSQRSSEVFIKWDKNRDSDIKEYEIIVNDNKVLKTNSAEIYVSELNNNETYKLKMRAVDSTGAKSETTEFNVKPSEDIVSFFVNAGDNSDNFGIGWIIKIILSSIFLSILTLWVIDFRINKLTIFTIGLMPPITILSYLILAISVLLSINSTINKVLFSLSVSIGYVLAVYLLILTANILNTSNYMTIPLEQAAKASQFIFSLISSYLMFIFAFGSNVNVLVKLFLIVPLIFFFSFSAITALKIYRKEQSMKMSLNITFIMTLYLVVISVWPVNFVYSMLSAAVIFYVLLSIALETRAKLNRYIWIEFITLFILITIMLFTSSVWGVNGTLI